MSLDSDKFVDSVRQKINHFLSNTSADENSSDSALTPAEAECLNQKLSGEYITQGFSESEAEELANNFSSQSVEQIDTIKYSDNIKKSVTFYGEEREGILDLTPDSIKYYISKYPNIAKAYISNGIVTLLDSKNRAILDSSGQPVTINCNSEDAAHNLDIVSFYINHVENTLDVNKLFELQALQDSVNSTPLTDKSYRELQSEIEIQKLDMMSEEEQKNYMTAKMWNAFNRKDKSAWLTALGEFYEHECRLIDKNLGITGTKEFLKQKTHLNDLVAYIDRILDDKTDKLTKTEQIWEIIKGIGDAIDAFIGTQGTTMMSVWGAAAKAASAVPKIGPILAGAIQAYFGEEGLVLIGSGVIDSAQAQTKEQARNAGAEFGLGGIMAKGGLSSFKAGFKGLELKEFRSKISKTETLEELDVIREIIEESSYSKAEKQMLKNECAKQQGYIQSNWKEVQQSAKESPLNNRSASENFDDQKIRSQLAFKLFKICKTPVQRQMAKIILNDKRLYLSACPDFEAIIKNCTSQEVLNMYMQYLSKIMQNSKLYEADGFVDPLMLCNILKLSPELFNTQMKILDAYAKKDINIAAYVFRDVFYLASDGGLKTYEKLLEFLMNKNLYSKLSHDFAIGELRGIISCDSAISLEKILSSSDAKRIASEWITNKKVTNLRNKFLEDETLYKGEPIYLKNGTLLADYGASIARILDKLNDYLEHCPKDKADYAYNFIEKILLNESFRKDFGVLQSIENILMKDSFYTEEAFRIKEQVFKIFETKEIQGFSSDKLSLVLHYLDSNFINLNDKITLRERIKFVLNSFDEIYTNFTSGREYSYGNVTDLYLYTKSRQTDIIIDMCKNKDYSAQNILYVASVTSEKTVNFIRKITNSNRLTTQERVSTIMAVGDNADLMKITEFLLNQGNLNLKVLPKIIEATKIMDAHDAGGNNGKIDPKKVDKYLRLLQNPKTRDWVIQMLNEGWDIETISRLSATKQGFFTENNSTAHVKDENIKYFMEFGLNEKEANAVVKSISQGGAINTEMQNTAVDLINAGIPKHRIGQILSSATISGEYNARVPADAMALNGLGLNAFAERYLPVLNNISTEDAAVKFNSKVKKQLKTMIENIPESTKPALRAKGFDLEGILKKLDAKGIVKETKNGKPEKVLNGLRNRSDITGFERMLIDKFNPVESVWRSPERTREWAEEKYNTYKTREYNSTRVTEQVSVEEVNIKRAEGLKSWFDYMDNEPELKDNPFARVILSEFITKDLLPENSSVPPVLDKGLVKQTLADALSKGASFEKGYRAELNNAAKKSSNAMEVEIDGRKMTWFTVPQTDSSHPDFKANAAKVRAFSDGTNWCIRTWNADNYIQQGNIHFLVDETGLTQVCIREGELSGFRHTKFKGTIAEIQKRQQNFSVPVAYIDFINDFISKKKLKGCEDKIKEAQNKKPEFDTTKTKLQKLAEKKDYKAILEYMGINVKVLPDGSWEISHYISYMNEIALNDYGIKENDLLANVSKISGDADFRDSNVTALPNLKEVGGELNFGYSDISNLKQLQKIKGKKINW